MAGPRTDALGAAGEAIAAAYLRQLGYKLLFQRWRKGSHEIDIVAWDQSEIVFVEVRTVSAATPWHPEHTIGPRKKEGLLRAAQTFLAEHPAYAQLPARIDVVAIRMGTPPEVQLFRDAFR